MSQPPPVSVNGKPSLSRMNARIWSAAGVKNMACTPRITQTTPLFFNPYALLEPPPDLRLIFEVGAAKLRFQVTLFVGDEPAGDPPDKEGHHHDGRQAPSRIQRPTRMSVMEM